MCVCVCLCLRACVYKSQIPALSPVYVSLCVCVCSLFIRMHAVACDVSHVRQCVRARVLANADIYLSTPYSKQLGHLATQHWRTSCVKPFCKGEWEATLCFSNDIGTMTIPRNQLVNPFSLEWVWVVIALIFFAILCFYRFFDTN